jgi:hypothetical protein
MNEIKKRIEIIMQGKVENLVKLTDNQLDLVLTMIFSARYFHALEAKPVEAKPVKKKRKVKE